LAVHSPDFRCIRLLTTGCDGELDLRRAIWYSPATGIIREEKACYRSDKLVSRDVSELFEWKRVL
jgi:hypothetical protein